MAVPVPQTMAKIMEVISSQAAFKDFLRVIFGAPVSDTSAAGAGTTRESDSRVDPAHENFCSHCCILSLWIYTSHIKARV